VLEVGKTQQGTAILLHKLKVL